MPNVYLFSVMDVSYLFYILNLINDVAVIKIGGFLKFAKDRLLNLINL